MTKSRARKFADIMGGTFVGLIEDGQIDIVDVDGLSALQTKLNGIEVNATADQTHSEIRDLITAGVDTNVFTDEDHSKLDGIEAGATADQTASEIKTAYESNANTNEFSDAEQSKLAGIEAGATGDQTASEIRSLVEAATDSNVFTDADHSKLNAIEASADVTDTANVVAALTAGANVTIAANGTISSTDTNTVYTHPTHPGDDFSVDTGALTGATVVSDIDINVTTDSLGHVTDANGSVATRTLTLANLGYTGATNANYINNNNQLSNGAGYVNTSDSRLSNARQCNNTFNNPTTSRNNLGLGTGNGVTFASVTAGSYSGNGSGLTGIAIAETACGKTGQNWSSPSRSLNTTYQNTSGAAIMVSYSAFGNNWAGTDYFVGNVGPSSPSQEASRIATSNHHNIAGGTSFIVPNNYYYNITKYGSNGAYSLYWTELS